MHSREAWGILWTMPSILQNTQCLLFPGLWIENYHATLRWGVVCSVLAITFASCSVLRIISTFLDVLILRRLWLLLLWNWHRCCFHPPHGLIWVKPWPVLQLMWRVQLCLILRHRIKNVEEHWIWELFTPVYCYWWALGRSTLRCITAEVRHIIAFRQ